MITRYVSGSPVFRMYYLCFRYQVMPGPKFPFSLMFRAIGKGRFFSFSMN